MQRISFLSLGSADLRIMLGAGSVMQKEEVDSQRSQVCSKEAHYNSEFSNNPCSMCQVKCMGFGVVLSGGILCSSTWQRCVHWVKYQCLQVYVYLKPQRCNFVCNKDHCRGN